MFDAIAGRYDLLNHLLSAGLDRRWRRRVVDELNLTGREVVLDLCTGTADLALTAAGSSGGRPLEAPGSPSSEKRARRVVGVDFSAEMLLVGRGKLSTAPVDLIRGDAAQIPLSAATVDAVTIGFGIRNVEQPLVACREILRVLRHEGKLVVLEFSLPRSAVLRTFYLWYFRRVLPVVGRMISRHPSAYSYLPESVEAFPSPDDFCGQLRRVGFGTVHAVPLTFGIVHMFVAVKNHAARPGAIIQ